MIALLVWLESRGPVLYKDERMGKDGKAFSCLKFRTMVLDAEVILQGLLETDFTKKEEYLTFHKLREDPRITRIGRLLRKTSLDELPQLWNVLRGEMSLVGPRPYKAHESKDVGLLQNEILRVPPGISGLWQVAGRNHTTFEERVLMDAYYVRNWSIWLDLVILARTVASVFSSRGAY
jgi:lipopolysaccharide/colanic/teichoic acid biosynthesis glycosyltransferase